MSVKAVMGREIIKIMVFKKLLVIWKSNLDLNLTSYIVIDFLYTKDLQNNTISRIKYRSIPT